MCIVIREETLWCAKKIQIGLVSQLVKHVLIVQASYLADSKQIFLSQIHKPITESGQTG
jgi:hypothetical protein